MELLILCMNGDTIVREIMSGVCACVCMYVCVRGIFSRLDIRVPRVLNMHRNDDGAF